ncbi:ABC-F family ATP-binding cassette domain-containing protein [Salibacterium halotolerans]|uniref:ATP-binding cassette, subfamily F, uup n=1 Tax=Salibacterium halotolerans TaxID=1884432 RepID=A0A1I5RM12_9BACI|nr:ABC-F family ATP-binding cassette domain-containing protein [Salibacterium halotolerans]SFP59594.1 ATP-binding cassette, subfamily F, uup [Salibacterium halotolerans]
MSVLRAENVYQSFGDKTLFDHISFVIENQDRIGLIGVNGTGKSSLLKILAGIESPEQGELIHANSLQVEYLPQEPELEEELTVLDQIYYGESDVMKAMRRYEKALTELEENSESADAQDKLMKAQQAMDNEQAWEANTTAKQVLTRLGITAFRKKVKELSGGQKKRVAIAKALIQPADLLIMDEPTNHLDNESIEWLENFLSSYHGALLLVTHDRYFLNRVTNRIYELDHGSLYVYEGNYELFLEQKAEREAREEQEEAKRQNILRTELAWLRKQPKARGTKQKARVDRVEEMKNQSGSEKKQDVDFAIGSTRLGKKVMEAEGLSKTYGGATLFSNFDYLVTPGERLGIVGPNGSGKTTLLNVLAGKTEPDEGWIERGPTVRIGYYSQEQEDLDENKRVIEFIRETAEIVTTVDGREITAEQMLERFLFPRPLQWNYIYRLSGGERRRLYLLSVLMEEPNVLFLDEPTNDLDTQTLSVLENYLDQFPGVVITVSHDRYFLDRVVNRLLVFQDNGTIERYQGSYKELIEERKEQEAAAAAPLKQKTEEKPKASRKKMSYKEKQEWETIEAKIDELEQEKAEVEAKVEQAGSDFEKAQEWVERQKELDTEIEQAVDRWTELSMIAEELEEINN